MHGVPKENIEPLIPDPIVVQIPILDDAVGNSPLGQTSDQFFNITMCPDDLLAKAVAAAGELGSVITKEHLLAATERADEATLIWAEHQVATLFRAITVLIGKDETRRKSIRYLSPIGYETQMLKKTQTT
jgi:hypothetical protein